MNRLLIPLACAVLLMAGCENADKPGAPTAPSGQSTVPPRLIPRGRRSPVRPLRLHQAPSRRSDRIEIGARRTVMEWLRRRHSIAIDEAGHSLSSECYVNFVLIGCLSPSPPPTRGGGFFLCTGAAARCP